MCVCLSRRKWVAFLYTYILLKHVGVGFVCAAARPQRVLVGCFSVFVCVCKRDDKVHFITLKHLNTFQSSD